MCKVDVHATSQQYTAYLEVALARFRRASSSGPTGSGLRAVPGRSSSETGLKSRGEDSPAEQFLCVLGMPPDFVEEVVRMVREGGWPSRQGR